MGLKDWLKPAWKDKDRNKRLAAVKTLTIQKHLISVALNDSDPEICDAALDRIELSTLWEPELLTLFIVFYGAQILIRQIALLFVESPEIEINSFLDDRDTHYVSRWGPLDNPDFVVRVLA